MGAAYVRKYFDIPSELSAKLVECSKGQGKTQAVFVREAIQEKIDSASDESKQPKKGKAK